MRGRAHPRVQHRHFSGLPPTPSPRHPRRGNTAIREHRQTWERAGRRQDRRSAVGRGQTRLMRYQRRGAFCCFTLLFLIRKVSNQPRPAAPAVRGTHRASAKDVLSNVGGEGLQGRAGEEQAMHWLPGARTSAARSTVTPNGFRGARKAGVVAGDSEKGRMPPGQKPYGEHGARGEKCKCRPAGRPPNFPSACRGWGQGAVIFHEYSATRRPCFLVPEGTQNPTPGSGSPRPASFPTNPGHSRGD